MNEDIINLSIGEKIRSLRHMNGINQSDLGKKIDVTFQQIQKYEKGHNKIVASKLYILAKKMNIDISFFFKDIENKLNTFNQYEENSPYILNEEQAEFEYNREKEEDSHSYRESIVLVKAFNSIKSSQTRKRFLNLLKAIAEEQN